MHHLVSHAISIGGDDVAHDIIDVAIGCIVSAVGWLGHRLERRLDDGDTRFQDLQKEVSETRSAVSRIEGHLDMAPFPYSD